MLCSGAAKLNRIWGWISQKAALVKVGLGVAAA
jgi:hypothetical protein